MLFLKSIVESYGPGLCTVSIDLAAHLLHQDALAKRADTRFLDRTFRSYVIVPRRTSIGNVNAAVCVSSDNSFDLSGFMGSIDEGNVHIIG